MTFYEKKSLHYCITHYLALHEKNVILQLHYNYTLPLPQAWSPLMS
jgi:hypothetical protein